MFFILLLLFCRLIFNFFSALFKWSPFHSSYRVPHELILFGKLSNQTYCRNIIYFSLCEKWMRYNISQPEEKKMSEVIWLGHKFINFSGNFTSVNYTAQLVFSLLKIWLGEGCYQLLSPSYCHPTLTKVKDKFASSFTVFISGTYSLTFIPAFY